MHTYKFKILKEEYEDFILEIEFKTNQTFLDFHNSIKNHCDIKSNELASFYVCDDKWRKKTEITLLDMGIGDGDIKVATAPKIYLMENLKLNQIINDPHQKFLYVYDFLKAHTFQIELIGIKTAKEGVDYPCLVKKEGFVKIDKSSKNIEAETDIIPEKLVDVDSFFGDNADIEDIENLGTDMFFDLPEDN